MIGGTLGPVKVRRDDLTQSTSSLAAVSQHAMLALPAVTAVPAEIDPPLQTIVGGELPTRKSADRGGVDASRPTSSRRSTGSRRRGTKFALVAKLNDLDNPIRQMIKDACG